MVGPSRPPTGPMVAQFWNYACQVEGPSARDVQQPQPHDADGNPPPTLDKLLVDRTDFQTFFSQAPAMNPARDRVSGSVCGVKVQEIEEPLMREIRILDKLVDELAKGKAMEKILRQP